MFCLFYFFLIGLNISRPMIKVCKYLYKYHCFHWCLAMIIQRLNVPCCNNPYKSFFSVLIFDRMSLFMSLSSYESNKPITIAKECWKLERLYISIKTISRRFSDFRNMLALFIISLNSHDPQNNWAQRPFVVEIFYY